MGADLIGYLVKGPKTLKGTKKDAEALYEWSKKKYGEWDGKLILHNEDEDDRIPSPTEDPEWWDGVKDDPDAETECGLPLSDFLATKEEFVKEFMSFKKFWMEEGARDLRSRTDPDDPTQVIVFAGELSWGDEPEGVGYLALKAMYKYRLNVHFGIR